MIDGLFLFFLFSHFVHFASSSESRVVVVRLHSKVVDSILFENRISEFFLKMFFFINLVDHLKHICARATTLTVDKFGNQPANDIVHERDYGIGKVRLRSRDWGCERSGDCGRGEAVESVEATNHGRQRDDEPS